MSRERTLPPARSCPTSPSWFEAVPAVLRGAVPDAAASLTRGVRPAGRSPHGARLLASPHAVDVIRPQVRAHGSTGHRQT